VPDSRWSLGTRLTALCGATAILLTLIAGGAAAAAVNNRRSLDEVFNRVGTLRTASDALVTAMLNQETGIRGYAANGHAADLAPYNDGRRQEQQLTTQLGSGLGAWPQVLARLRTAQAAISDWQGAVAEPVIARVRAGDRTGAQALIDDAARARFDRVRNTLADLQAGVVQLRDAAVNRLVANSDRIVELLVAAALVVLLAGVLLALLLRYLVTNPVRRLAGEVRRVAAGEYEHGVGTYGPSEVTALARDVDGMRQKIVKDLAEVRAARAAVEEARQQLELQAAELTRSNRDLEQFAYVASHDLQEPLRKVASFCQLLQRRYQGQLDERADQYIAFAVNGAQRMQRLINDLLAFSRIGRATPGFTDVDLNRVVADEVAQLDLSEDDPAEVTWSDLPVVRGEDPLLSTLLANLIGNALKFRRPGEPARVHLSGRLDGDQWEISCVDHGIGIETEFAEKVFVIFQRLHSREAYAGTGIGLAVAKKIVEYHGGVIWIDPSHTDGTAIRFNLPVSPHGNTGTTPSADESGDRLSTYRAGNAVDVTVPR
jgi:signal transduction histidine kinase